MEENLKSIQLQITGIKADEAKLSRMFLVFDANRPTELFNGIKQAIHDLEQALMQNGILTVHGIGTAEYKAYLEYMAERVPQMESELSVLINAKDNVLNSGLAEKYVLVDIVQEKIDLVQKEVDGYYSMFKEVQIVSEEEAENITEEDGNNVE